MKNDPNKQRKVAVQYVELCGLKHGERQDLKRHHNEVSLTQGEIAKQLGVSLPELQRMLEIERKLTPDIKDLLDSGIISKTSASKIWTKLSETEQSKFIESMGKDHISNLTAKETEQYIEKARGLEVTSN